MAICEISSGRGYFCAGQVGGIKKVYLANWYSEDAIASITQSATTGIITAVLQGASAGVALKFYEFDLDRQLSSFNQTIITGGGGALTYQTDLDLHMSHDSQESWARMQNVCEGVFQVVVEDNNGVYYFAGLSNGLQVASGTYAHGGDVAYTDYVGYVIQMTGAEPIPASNMSTVSPFVTYSSTMALQTDQYYDPQV